MHRVWVEHTRLHSVGEAVHASSSDLVSRLVETRGQAPAPSPAPVSSAPTALVWCGPLLAASPLTCYQHSPPANITLSLIPLTSSPGAKPCAQAGLLPRGDQKLREGAGSPLAQIPPTPQTPSPAAHQLGDLAQVAALLGSLLFSIPQGEVTLNQHLVAPSQVFNNPGQGKCPESTCLGMNSADATANSRSSAGKVLSCSIG